MLCSALSTWLNSLQLRSPSLGRGKQTERHDALPSHSFPSSSPPFSRYTPFLGECIAAELWLSPWLNIYRDKRKKINSLLIEHTTPYSRRQSQWESPPTGGQRWSSGLHWMFMSAYNFHSTHEIITSPRQWRMSPQGSDSKSSHKSSVSLRLV